MQASVREDDQVFGSLLQNSRQREYYLSVIPGTQVQVKGKKNIGFSLKNKDVDYLQNMKIVVKKLVTHKLSSPSSPMDD